jgi:hypothetical protein
VLQLQLQQVQLSEIVEISPYLLGMRLLLEVVAEVKTKITLQQVVLVAGRVKMGVRVRVLVPLGLLVKVTKAVIIQAQTSLTVALVAVARVL